MQHVYIAFLCYYQLFSECVFYATEESIKISSLILNFSGSRFSRPQWGNSTEVNSHSEPNTEYTVFEKPYISGSGLNKSSRRPGIQLHHS